MRYLSPFAALALAASCPTALRAEQPAALCAQERTNDTLRPIPKSLVPAVNTAFGTALPPEVAVATTVYRCANTHVLMCTAGANLPCGKANVSRTANPGTAAWCRTHPNAADVPAFATGHDTIYAWACNNGAPRIARQTLAPDDRGFVAAYWRRMK